MRGSMSPPCGAMAMSRPPPSVSRSTSSPAASAAASDRVGSGPCASIVAAN
jgi:hypothetical protein